MGNNFSNPIFLACACTPAIEGGVDDYYDAPVPADIPANDAGKQDSWVAEILEDAVAIDVYLDTVKDSLYNISDQQGFPDQQTKDEGPFPPDVTAKDAAADQFTSKDYFVPDQDVCVTFCPDASETKDAALSPDIKDVSGDASACQPVSTSENACNAIDDDCDGATDEGCLNQISGGKIVLYGVDMTAANFRSELMSETAPGATLPATILFNGDPGVGIELCDFTYEAGLAEIIVPCDDESAPLENADTLVYQGEPYPGNKEWFFYGGGEHYATLSISATGAGLLFGPEAPLDNSQCNYLFNEFSCTQ